MPTPFTRIRKSMRARAAAADADMDSGASVCLVVHKNVDMNIKKVQAKQKHPNMSVTVMKYKDTQPHGSPQQEYTGETPSPIPDKYQPGAGPVRGLPGLPTSCRG